MKGINERISLVNWMALTRREIFPDSKPKIDQPAGPQGPSGESAWTAVRVSERLAPSAQRLVLGTGRGSVGQSWQWTPAPGPSEAQSLHI